MLSCISNKAFETIDKIKLQHKRELQRLQIKELREVRKEEKNKDNERKDEYKKEHYEEKINKEMEINRMKNDIIKDKKKNAIEPYIEQAQEDNIELTVDKCPKCDKYKCKQYDFTNGYDYKYYKRSYIKGEEG